MALTAVAALEDLRQYAASRSFTISPPLFAIFESVERFSESIGNDPYAKSFLVALLRDSSELREAVTALGGDPDAGADFIDACIEADPIDGYGETALYSDANRHDDEERPAIIDLTIAAAQSAGRTDLRLRDLAIALIDFGFRIEADVELDEWNDPRMRTEPALSHIADAFDASLDVPLADLRKRLAAQED